MDIPTYGEAEGKGECALPAITGETSIQGEEGRGFGDPTPSDNSRARGGSLHPHSPRFLSSGCRTGSPNLSLSLFNKIYR